MIVIIIICINRILSIIVTARRSPPRGCWQHLPSWSGGWECPIWMVTICYYYYCYCYRCCSSSSSSYYYY